jgi:hypothetical protein
MDGDLAMEMIEYYADFMQNVYAQSGTNKDFYEAVFTETVCNCLIEQAEIEDYTVVSYKKSSQGLRVDAWDHDLEREKMILIVTDFRFGNVIESLPQTDIEKNFRRAERFFVESLNPRFYHSLEESSPGHALALDIYSNSTQISYVQVILLSNGLLSDRVKYVQAKTIQGHNFTYDIWDISRLFRIESSGKTREDINIDFTEYCNGGIKCLNTETGGNDCESYLFVLPGKVVANLYDKYGERLLEQNVRTFLQFRGNVNKGIRTTITKEPQMFFAYNNGLSTTADKIIFNDSKDKILAITNLQIVNGGQTTASIYTAMKKDAANLTEVSVQVKLSIIPPDKVDDVVPLISQFANTQNKVSAADFFSNSPFHLRIEDLSRRIWAPSPEGGLRETHWFYERTRGQYINAQARLTPSKIRDFLAINPKNQMFSKTELAKYEYSFGMLPYKVCLGAQKCFAQFAHQTGSEWEKNDKQFNELYFKQLVAKAIMFRFLEKSIMKQPWYDDYRAEIIAYTISKLAKMVSNSGKFVNLIQIWQKQDLTNALKSQLLVIAEYVNKEIKAGPDSNVREWCKKGECWAVVQGININLNQDVINELIDLEQFKEEEKSAITGQVMDTEQRGTIYVVKKGAEYWKEILAFSQTAKILSPKEESILGVACAIPYKIPSDKQSKIILDIERKVIQEGFISKR